MWFAECLECYFTLLSPGRGLLLHSSPFNWVGVHVQVGRCQPDTHSRVNMRRLQRWQAVESSHWCMATNERLDKYDSYREYSLAARVLLLLRQCACAAKLSQSFQLNALRLLCSSAFPFVLACWSTRGLVHFSAVDLGIEFKKNRSDSGMRWGVDLGGHVWLPGFLLYSLAICLVDLMFFVLPILFSWILDFHSSTCGEKFVFPTVLFLGINKVLTSRIGLIQ